MLGLLYPSKKEPTPDLDPFYGYTSTVVENAIHQPGTLLRIRAIQLADFPGYDARHLRGWQLAYITCGQTQAEATVTVATIIVPANAGDGEHVLFIAPKTDAASPTCRTSYMLRRGSGSLTGAASEQIFMIDFLHRGWTCVQVDHQGQHDAFGAGPTAGHALLDAIRATLACPEVKLASQNRLKIALWGYSGGAIAVGWAALMLHTYAPELAPMIKAISHGGIPCNLNAVAIHVNDGLAAGLIVGVMRGLANVYPAFDDWLQANTNQRGKRMLELARQGCFFSFMTKNTFGDVLNLKKSASTHASPGYFTTTGNPLQATLPSRVLNENDMLAALAVLAASTSNASSSFTPIPMFVYQSTNDEVVPLETVDELVSLWTRTNYVHLHYHKVPVLPHVATIFAMHSQNVQWIADRFEGKPLVDGTAEQSVSVNDENAQAVLGPQRGKELETFYEDKYKGSVWW
jgi:pimeloyl-ACP methyl ester carboxylesterase